MSAHPVMVEPARPITPSHEFFDIDAISRARSIALRQAFFACIACLSVCTSCGSTDDTIGFNHPAAAAGASSVDRSYPNLFGELLGKTDDEITARLDHDFAQLFHGDPATEAIYVEVDANQAYVWDPRQMDIRSDGFANALLVSVELDRREEFDKLWRFARANVVLEAGPLGDYLRARCDLGGANCDETVLAEPQFAATTALWLARGRWGTGGELDYGAEADRLLAAILRSEPGAATTLGDLSGMIDQARWLPLTTPYASSDMQTKAAVMTPAYFAFWAEKSGDSRLRTLAQNARDYLASVVDSRTGLVPDVTALDGTVQAGNDSFSANSYTVPLALSLDAVWFGASAWHVAEANRLLDFFQPSLAAQSFSATYSLSGQAGAPLGDVLSLQAPLCTCAVAATTSARTELVQAAWDAQLNTGTSRKFGNLSYMLSSLLLSGRLRVY